MPIRCDEQRFQEPIVLLCLAELAIRDHKCDSTLLVLMDGTGDLGDHEQRDNAVECTK